MRHNASLEKVKAAKQTLVDMIADSYADKLFGTPPSNTASGKLVGGTPPDMNLVEKLYK